MLLVRADANMEIGTGHVMRCLALAQAWQDAGGEAMFASATCTDSLRTRLAEENFRLAQISGSIGSSEDADQTLAVARAHNASWIVLDGYSFSPEYERVVGCGAAKLARIDDLGECENSRADAIVNQNLHARESMYSQRGSKLLLGPKFALIRREFKDARPSARIFHPLATKLLVSMGGTDPRNMSMTALEAFQSSSVDDLEVRVAVSSSNPGLAELKRACERVRGARLAIDPNMSELLAWADVALAAAGLVCWEMCLTGLPALLIDVASNQTPIAQSLQSEGIAVHLGNSDQVTAKHIASEVERLLRSRECRQKMSERGRTLVDGEGAARVAAEFASL